MWHIFFLVLSIGPVCKKKHHDGTKIVNKKNLVQD